MEHYIYLGTYTQKGSQGIYGMTVSPEGKLISGPELVAEQPSPTYFYLSHDHKMLYTVSEPEKEKGLICVYKIEPQTGALSLHSKKEAAGGGLCYITMDQNEEYTVVISYEEATIQVYPMDHHQKLTSMFCLRRHIGNGLITSRQERAHAHNAVFTPDGKYLMVCDLGMDCIMVYTMNYESGKLHRGIGLNVVLPPGSGPRHLVFSPDGRFAYVTCELSSEVIVLAYHGEDGFEIVERVSSRSPEFASEHNYPSAVRITKNGEDLYVSNRGEDSIAHFKVDPITGKLSLYQTHSTRGWYPRDFILTRDEMLLIAVNQLSDNMVIFRREPETGSLTFVEEVPVVSMPAALMEK